MIEIENSRDGDLTAKIDNLYLHSAYSPKREALKFFENNKLEKYKTFILIEPCLNYISEIIRESIDNPRIISVYFNPIFYKNDKGKSDLSFCVTENMTEFLSFLNHAISELNLEGLKVLEWPTAIKYFNETARDVKRIISQKIHELHGNITTISGFGKRHFRNFFKNYLFTENYLRINRSSKPVVLAGSGPGLQNDIDFIAGSRNKIILISLPSSLQFLRYNGIRPDIIISTDPGYYASFHLHDCKDIPVATTLTASLPTEVIRNGVLFFSQKYYLENLLQETSNFMYIPANGTVAGSALYLAKIISSGPLLISGLDFSYNDLISHNRPHTFDNIIEKSSRRTNSINSLYFKRNILPSERVSGKIRTTRSLKIYESWFASKSRNFNRNCFFLKGSTAPGEFISLPYKEIEKYFIDAVPLEFCQYKNSNFSERKHQLNYILKSKIDMLTNLITVMNGKADGVSMFKLLNNDIIFNLFLPELLEFKRHNLNKKGKEVQNKAVSLIIKTRNFLKEYFDYV